VFEIFILPFSPATDTPDCPDYSRLLQFVAEQMRWNLAEYDILRLRVEYPVMGSAIRVQFHYD
jgi:hypothetical protein